MTLIHTVSHEHNQGANLNKVETQSKGARDDSYTAVEGKRGA